MHIVLMVDVSPYQYSLVDDGLVTIINVFSGLAIGTYNIVVQDSDTNMFL